MMIRLLVLMFAVLLAGCSDGRRVFTLGVAEGVDREAVAAAAEMWNRAGVGAEITVEAWGPTGDVNVGWGDLPAQQCGEERERSAGTWIILGNHMTERCMGMLGTVIAHELGHYMANRGDHLTNPGTLMFWDAEGVGLAPTPDDVLYVGGP